MGISRVRVRDEKSRRRQFVRRVVAGLATVAVMGSIFGGLSAELPAAQAVVTTPTPTQAVISVKVGGARLPNGTVAGVANVRLSLYAAGTATTNGSTAVQGTMGARYNPLWSWTTCISDGDCNFVIPVATATTGSPSQTSVPRDTRFWVAQAPTDASPTGYYSNPQLRVGGFGATPEFTWGYRFRTDTELRRGTTYLSTAPMTSSASYLDADRGFMRNREDDNAEGGMGENLGRTNGVWSQSVSNPVFPAQCGLDIAIVTDTSGSLGDAGMASVKSTMDTFVDELQGTPTRMSLFSFSTMSPGSGASNHPALLPVTTAAQASVYKAQYSGWISGGGTNWDRGLAAAANSGNSYDLVVLLTDGNPTTRGSAPNAGASAFNAFTDIDAGIFSSNQLKATGARVVAIGAGTAVNSAASAFNLRAVSGTTEGQDFFRTTDFKGAADILSALAKANCQGSIVVQKMIVPTGKTIADAVVAPAGWEFTASSQTSTMTVPALATAATTTESAGRVAFGLSFASPSTTGTVQVLETQQPGYEIVPVGVGAAARNATCINSETGAAVAVTNAGTAATPGFTTTAEVDRLIRCTIYNTIPPTPGKLVVQKSSTPASGTTVAPDEIVEYSLTFSNTGGLPVNVDHTDHLAGVVDDASLVGGPTSSNPNLAVTTLTTPDRFRVVGTVPAGASYTVTYSFKVNGAGTTPGDGRLANFVTTTGTPPPTQCVATSGLCTEHPVLPEWTITKAATVAGVVAPGGLVQPGDTITYKVTATATRGPVTGVVLTDDLSDVLDESTFGSATLVVGGGAPIAVPLAGSSLVTPTFTLTTGSTAVLSYTVTVNPGAWLAKMANVVTGEGSVPPIECAAGTPVDQLAAQCQTLHVTGALLLIEKLGQGVNGPMPIDGSDFDLLTDVAGTPGVPLASPALTPTGAVGRFELRGIAPGNYWLVETRAPVGHSLLAEPVAFTLTAGGEVTFIGVHPQLGAVGTTITVTDDQAVALPLAGGPGHLWFWLCGGFVLAAAAAVAMRSRLSVRTASPKALP